MESCKWVHYKGESLWYLECGKTQGYKVGLKQKTCFCPRLGCRKRIERVEIDELSPRDKDFIEMLTQFR
jgi:hypothetical protein